MRCWTIPLLAAAVGCSTTVERPMDHATLLWSSHKERPAWTVEGVRRAGGRYLVVGMSDLHPTERGAREAAVAHAAASAARVVGVSATTEYQRHAKGEGREEERLETQVSVEQSDLIRAEQMLGGLRPGEWYMEQWQEAEGVYAWKAWVRAEVTHAEETVQTKARVNQ